MDCPDVTDPNIRLLLLCCAMLYYAIIYYTMLHYATLHYDVLYYTVLCYTILYDSTLHYTMLSYRLVLSDFGTVHECPPGTRLKTARGTKAAAMESYSGSERCMRDLRAQMFLLSGCC